MIRPDFRKIKHSELYHYGVSARNGAPGPGSGRYPLGSGSEPFQGMNLSEKEKKKISKQYEKKTMKASNVYSKNIQKLYNEARNKAAEYMNNKGIDDFNKQQQKKYGDNFAKRDGYVEEFQKLLDKIVDEEYVKVNIDFIKNNKYFKMAEKISEEFQMESWDPKAKENSDYIKKLYKLAEEADRR